MEYVILLSGYLLATVGMLGSYIMALKFSKNPLFAFLTAFVFSTAPVFVELTRWTATTRCLFLALLPLILWGIFTLKADLIDHRKVICLSTIVSITLFAAHRISWLIILIVIAFIITMIIWHIKDRQILMSLHEYMPKYGIPIIISLLCICAFLLQFSGISFYRSIWSNYQTGAFATGTDIFSLLLNMATNYTGQIGILFPISLIGFFMLAKKPGKSISDILIIVTIILLLAISAYGLYVALFLLPFAALLISLVLSRLIQSHGGVAQSIGLKLSSCGVKISFTKALSLVLVVGILVSVCFSGYMVQRHLKISVNSENKAWMTDHTPPIGNYLKNNGEVAFTSNDGALAKRIYASTGVPIYNRGYNNIDALIHGWINKDDIEVKMLSLSSLSMDTNYLFQQVNIPPLQAKEDIRAYVANNRLLGSKGLGLKVYDNHEGSVWLL